MFYVSPSFLKTHADLAYSRDIPRRGGLLERQAEFTSLPAIARERYRHRAKTIPVYRIIAVWFLKATPIFGGSSHLDIAGIYICDQYNANLLKSRRRHALHSPFCSFTQKVLLP
jgi:hypothetical protein